MNEVGKTKAIWTQLEFDVLKGKGIDIGYGGGLAVMPDARGFDLQDGDANHITAYVKDTFDYVFSSHCLEHMLDPMAAIQEWWQLVKPGGYLFFLVPDEDLYEQGYWPSVFNGDHKWTFTISKSRSWSPKSINVLDICSKLSPLGGKLVNLMLQDHNYNRVLIGKDQTLGPALAQIQCIIKKR